MNKRSSAQTENLWNRLTENQQEDLLTALNEIQNPEKLMPHAVIKKEA